MQGDPSELVGTVWGLEAARVIGALTRMTHDVGLAEDLAQDALVAALEQWPATGVPENPGAWLTAVAKRRAVDHFRRTAALRRGTDKLGHDLEEVTVPELLDAVDLVEDDVLRLMFLTCHPVLSPESRAALTLRLVGGLTTAEIARGFLVKETAMRQRISRAKKALVGVDVSLPTGRERDERLADVMGVIYLVFNEGYAATSGDDWMRPELCREALRLARVLAGLAPQDPEVHGLVALVEIQASRSRARVGSDGQAVLLEAQDRRLWDQLLIRRGLHALERAQALDRPVGAFVLQAAIAACHARARRPQDTDWRRIASLYDLLARLTGSPVVQVNRAVAHGRAFGPAAGLDVLDALDALDVSRLAGSPLLPSVRGDLLERAGQRAEAAELFWQAAALSRNSSEQSLLRSRAQQLG